MVRFSRNSLGHAGGCVGILGCVAPGHIGWLSGPKQLSLAQDAEGPTQNIIGRRGIRLHHRAAADIQYLFSALKFVNIVIHTE